MPEQSNIFGEIARIEKEADAIIDSARQKAKQVKLDSDKAVAELTAATEARIRKTSQETALVFRKKTEESLAALKEESAENRKSLEKASSEKSSQLTQMAAEKLRRHYFSAN